ncbi:hypothetical protein KFE25_008577 [Diacronema lutheri]|uniref:Cilia- and flagella-associated protein 263 n=1 Tax=Diacronema lutheri TaxID=2081491 RepID=A0A8J5XJ84_DIALT|nr:hypothetical protein KFE25_008577 [Diacronema lutheri]
MDEPQANAKLEAELQELLTANEALLCENELFESYLERANPALLASEDDPGAATGRHKKQAAAKRVLTAEQKHDLAQHEVEEVKEQIERTKATSEKLLDGLRAQMEECDLRIAEIKKEAYEFKRDIVVGAENFRTGKTAAEKVIRYMEDKQRTKGATIEKLRLKNQSLKTQIQKVEQQLQLKEEMGEVLHVIDFDQLKIENQQYLEKIEERNSELLRLKLTTGNTVQTLNTLKRRLRNLTAESDWLKHEIAQRNDLIAKVSDEISKVELEKKHAEQFNRKLKRETGGENNMPQVLDYVAQKAELYELEKEIKNWERKVEIADIDWRRKQPAARR